MLQVGSVVQGYSASSEVAQELKINAGASHTSERCNLPQCCSETAFTVARMGPLTVVGIIGISPAIFFLI